MLLDPVMGAISASMMGHLGTQQLSAISLGILTTSFCTFLFSFLVFLTTPEVAGAVSRKDYAEASRIASKGFWLAGGLGAVTALTVFFASDMIVRVMSPPEPEVAIYAAGYMKVRSLGVFAALVQFVATGTFRGFKDTSTPLIAAVLSASTSLVLNLAFIKGLGLGVYGAGLATTMAQIVSCTFLCSRMLSSGILRMEDLKVPPSAAAVMPMLRVGGILTLRNIISFGTVLYASKLCVSAGSHYQAGFEVIRQVWILTIQFFECLNVAAQSLCATYLGSGDKGNARLVLGRISFLGVSTGAAVGAVVFFNQMLITNVFTVDPVVIHQVAMALPMVCLMFPLDAAASIMDGSLLAARQTNFMSYTQMAGAIVQCTMLYALVVYSNISVLSTWGCLKLLTFVRIGAGVYRNFLTPKESAYFEAPVLGAVVQSPTPVASAAAAAAAAEQTSRAFIHSEPSVPTSVAQEQRPVQHLHSATSEQLVEETLLQQQQQQATGKNLERMVYTGSMFSSLGSYDTDSNGMSLEGSTRDGSSATSNDGMVYTGSMFSSLGSYDVDGSGVSLEDGSNSSGSSSVPSNGQMVFNGSMYSSLGSYDTDSHGISLTSQSSSGSAASSNGTSHSSSGSHSSGAVHGHEEASFPHAETLHVLHADCRAESPSQQSVDEAEQCLLSSIHVPALADGTVEILTVVGIAHGAEGEIVISMGGVDGQSPALAVAAVEDKPVPKLRSDYTPVPYTIDTVHLDFNLNDDVTTVHSKLVLLPRHNAVGAAPPLELNGRKDVHLVSLKVNGVELPASGYTLTEKTLTLHTMPAGDSITLDVVTTCKPQDNSLLEGLYKSGGNFCTQCESEGFRGITYFLDRPDVMAKFTTRMEAPKAAYPVLLGNGNLQSSGDIGEDRHFAVWVDPFPKPCYLFALVAGSLAVRERKFTTMTNKEVTLRIFVQEKNLSQVDFALESLVRSMKWDEDTYGLEYDLELFNIVAVDDFNMGAMENKSLNIFNSRLVLASPETATDQDYGRVQGVVGHEYFHNYTGNRVTCRDWFQLTLKEGLTVYRDQEFSADMNSRPVKRIEDVAMLRVAQFSEDSGPMAHPIRPESYIKMDNFYTLTVYEKGAEVVRLYDTLLGKDGFRKGMDLYFQRHDGCAVTCDDFRAAMADANGADLSQMARWYYTAGTPVVKVSTAYDAAARTFSISASQSTPPTPGQEHKEALLIPIAVGLLGPDGQDLPLTLSTSPQSLGTTAVLRLTEASQTFTFTGIDTAPTASFLRGFSAPIKLTVEGQTEEQLLFLFANDSDSFNRPLSSAPTYVKPVSELDSAFKAMAISLPSATELLDSIPGADPVLLHNVRMAVSTSLAARLRPELEAIVKASDSQPGDEFVFDAPSAGKRSIKNKALTMLSSLEDPTITAMLLQRFREATNMTDQIAALSTLVEISGPERDLALGEFFTRWQSEPLVILKWLGLQAMSNAPGNVALAKSLLTHPAFHITNPNNCYSLFLGFARSPINFHAADGSGYEFVADSILTVDKLNPQVASRIAGAFSTWRRFDSERQAMMKAQLERMVAVNGLSENVFEIVSKSLA
ncbi:MAG: hypothetical protein WDW38_001184 [Sanguina aurantia]